MSFDERMADVLRPGGRRSRTTMPPAAPAEGTVIAVGPDGLTCTLPAFDGGAHVWGPMPIAFVPPGMSWEDFAGVAEGRKVLVLFVGPGTAHPWAIGIA